MKFSELFSLVGGKESTNQIFEWLDESLSLRANLRGLVGSSRAVIASLAFNRSSKSFLCILPDKESAAYFFNDLENLLGEAKMSYESRSVFFFPATYKKPYELEQIDNANLLLRAEVINRLASFSSKALVVTYPEAVGEMILPKNEIGKNLLEATLGELLSVDFFLDLLVEYDFERVEFVAEPGQFSLRGGIIDVFSYSNDYPFRIEVSGDRVSSLRLFDAATQLSINKVDKVHILPNINKLANESKKREFLLESMPANTVVWCENMEWIATKLDSGFHKLSHSTRTILSETNYLEPKEMFISGNGFKERLLNCKLVEWNASPLEKDYNLVLNFAFRPQLSFNKNFDLIARHLEENSVQGIRNIILSDNPKQLSRIENILESIKLQQKSGYHHLQYEGLPLSLHEGFVDAHSQLAFFTDHQLFDRYHRFKVRDKFTGKQAMTIKDFGSLKPGDFVTHIDHGIGIYSGLEKIEVNGKIQESIRLIYKDNDVLYISIHALHRISRYSSKDGTAPSLHRLGSNTWANLKNKTKSKLKDIARDLIDLYAKRRSQDGFAFSADTYLQNELEASFIYEDTPDQVKATRDVKKDMEAPYPMDRLLCGDVGFGKTEIAIRAAFKAVNDSKQVAILVPTTILALQHFYTFSERLKDLPCRVDYINRFRSDDEKKQVLTDLQNGKNDIIIGTHRRL
ncbi:MAG TPA: transcription-repair coupling factor, partial [Bacteroidales bacterium]|nr:transcription-repair coupling factor [Bacteroidales bacterium]